MIIIIITKVINRNNNDDNNNIEVILRTITIPIKVLILNAQECQ